MAENTKIQWCHHTFNPWIGCSRVNEGCKNCYAEMLMDTRYGRVQWGAHGSRSLTNTWRDPIRWNKQAAAAGEQHKVFCASLSDVFEDWTGPITDSKDRPLYLNSHSGPTHGPISPWPMTAKGTTSRPLTMNDLRKRLFALIDATPNLIWLLLTKRPENIATMWPEGAGIQYPLRENVWLGTSVATQKNADDFIPRLQAGRTLASYLFLSLEPQIEFVNLEEWLRGSGSGPNIDWVISGGESQQGGEARRYDMNWARDLKDQCEQAGVPFFLKQLGSNAWSGSRKLNLKDSHGGDWMEWPEDLRVRECPETYFPELATRVV
jgi:protein gp37